MNYSERLKAIVEASGVKQKDIADALELSEATISNWLNGRVDLTFVDAERVLAVLREKTGRSKGLTVRDLVPAVLAKVSA